MKNEAAMAGVSFFPFPKLNIIKITNYFWKDPTLSMKNN